MHSTDNIDDGYLGSGKRLRYSLKKYGKENHERLILEDCSNQGRIVLQEREKFWVSQKSLEDPLCMNLDLGGNLKGSNKSDIVKRSMSQAAQDVGKRPEMRKMRSEIAKAAYLDPVKRERHRQGCIRAQNNQETKMKQAKATTRPETHRKRSEAARKSKPKISKAIKGRVWVTDGVVSKMVWPQDAKQHFDAGWMRGRSLSEETLVKMIPPNRSVGRLWITNGIKRKRVLSHDVQNYLDLGWHRGTK